MKKLLYTIIGFVILCLSFFSPDKKTEEKRIEEQGTDNLILKPFHMFGLLWSCSPDEEPEYGTYMENANNGGTGNGSNGGTGGHESNVGDGGNNNGNGTESPSHLSHYSSSHLSHQSHQSHSSHYSAH